MHTPGTKALLLWFVSFVLIVALLFLLLGKPGSPDGAGEAIGRVFAHTGIAALATWFLARKKTPPWSWPRFAAIYIAALVVLGLLAAFGHRSEAAERAFPFETHYSQEWSVERLPGVSSAPQDRDLGIREIARWEGADGSAVIAVSCSWLAKGDVPALDVQLSKVVDGLRATLASQNVSVTMSNTRHVSIGEREGLFVEAQVSRAESTVFRQQIAVTSTKDCFVAATFAGTPRAFEEQSEAFASALRDIRFR